MNISDKAISVKNLRKDFVFDRKSTLDKLLQSNLDFEKSGERVSRHAWHSFPAKFPPELPKYFIQNLTQPGENILDPMAGSCTTLLESVNLNRKAYGFEIDPLSIIIGRAKLQNIDKIEAYKTGKNILEFAKLSLLNKKNDIENTFRNRFDDKTIEFLEYWYLKETQLELVSLITEIEKVENKNIQDFLKLVFSSIIITKSGGITLSYDLAHTRPHKVTFKNINSAFAEFGKKLSKITTNGYTDLPPEFVLLEGNAKQIPLNSNCMDLIVTSPPYANNAIDYVRAHKFSLVWFNHSINQLKLLRRQYIGAEVTIPEHIVQLPNYTNSIIEKLKKVDKSKGKALERYYSEMLTVFTEMYRVLKPRRPCVIIVATSVLKGIDVQIDKCFREIGNQAGFELVSVGQRKIHRDKRMLPIGKLKNNQSKIENRMHNEFVIGFWKN